MNSERRPNKMDKSNDNTYYMYIYGGRELLKYEELYYKITNKIEPKEKRQRFKIPNPRNIKADSSGQIIIGSLRVSNKKQDIKICIKKLEKFIGQKRIIAFDLPSNKNYIDSVFFLTTEKESIELCKKLKEYNKEMEVTFVKTRLNYIPDEGLTNEPLICMNYEMPDRNNSVCIIL